MPSSAHHSKLSFSTDETTIKVDQATSPTPSKKQQSTRNFLRIHQWRYQFVLLRRNNRLFASQSIALFAM
jgi:hypothetical protein